MTTDTKPEGGALVAALMRDGPNFKQGWSFANALGSAANREGLVEDQGTAVRVAMLARDAVLEVLAQHVPVLTNEIESEINERVLDFLDQDAANLALRQCMCGERIDGFDDFYSHLRKVFNERGA